MRLSPEAVLLRKTTLGGASFSPDSGVLSQGDRRETAEEKTNEVCLLCNFFKEAQRNSSG